MKASSLEAQLGELIRDLVHAEVAAAVAKLATQQAAVIDDYLTTRQAAKYAAIAQGTLRRWIAEGRLKTTRAGRYYRVRRADLDQLLAQRPAGSHEAVTDNGLSPEEQADVDFDALMARRC